MITREFLGWSRPALCEARDRLDRRYRKGGNLDLGQVIVVVPGQRAGRRLHELLAFFADEQNLCLTPPRVITQEALPELLYTPRRPLANDLVQDLTWARAVRDTPEDVRRHLVPHPPAAEALRWLALGRNLRQLHVELAADALDFEAVARVAAGLPGFADAFRWQALVAVQQRYLALLQEHTLWDRETARLKAIEYREVNSPWDIVLLATVELTQTLRNMLDQVAARVIAYIAAPSEAADRFDAYGCLSHSAWCEAAVPLTNKQLERVDGPEDQAEAVTNWLAGLGGRYRLEDVAIGVPDPALASQLQRQLEQCGVPARWMEKLTVADTAPYRLLLAAAQYASRRRYDELAALLRHPDVEDWLRVRSARTKARGALARQLDAYYAEHLPSVISLRHVVSCRRRWPELASALQQIDRWVAGVSAPQPLCAWQSLFRDVLGAIYGHRTLRLDKPLDETLHAALTEILKALDRLDDVPADLDTVPLAAADAFEVVLSASARTPIPPPAGPEAVEILGWLELPLDDAPALAVTTFNEGFVPQATGADGFLPDGLRRRLGLVRHNDRRYARDAYATTVLCESRRELRVVFARRDTDLNPLQPSRLVFACPDDVMVLRARKYFGESKEPAPARRLLLAPGGAIPERSGFEPPHPQKKSPSSRTCP